MSLVRMDIQSVVVGAGPVASMVVLKPRHGSGAAKLPIRIGAVEAAAISMGVEGNGGTRPMTHDLLQSALTALGARVSYVVVHDVRDTTFFAQIQLSDANGEPIALDSRPSDAFALAVRMHVPIFATDEVLSTAALPDFDAVEKDEKAREQAAFHDFVENLSPEDFA